MGFSNTESWKLSVRTKNLLTIREVTETWITERNIKRIYYTRIGRKDFVNRFGFVPAVGKKEREIYSTDAIIRSNRWKEWFKYREYELVVQRSEPWCEVGKPLGEY